MSERGFVFSRVNRITKYKEKEMGVAEVGVSEECICL